MNIPAPLQDLLTRFVDDRESLTEEELASLVAALQEQPTLLAQLREQLQMDEILSQHGMLDRRNFPAQVEQRVSDYLRGEDELNQQAEDLREMALARVRESAGEKSSNRSMMFAWATALSLLMGVGVGFALWQRQEVAAILVRVDQAFGKVVIRRSNASDQYAQANFPLQAGDRVLVQHDAALTLKYADGTRVRLEGNTEINIPAKNTEGKRLIVDIGDVSAKVAKQPLGRPMIFATPHADAIVRGTELYLQVRDRQTQLEVAEGQVELVEHKTHDTQLIAATESAIATTGSKVAKKSIAWPTSREGLCYLFAGSKRPAVARLGSVLSPTKIAPLGAGANWNSLGHMELTGGCYSDTIAANPLASLLRENKGFSLEIVLGSNMPVVEEAHPIFALESKTTTLFALVQQQEKLWFVFDVPQQPLTHWPADHAIELGPIIAGQSMTHWLVSYDAERWIIARQSTDDAKKSDIKTIAQAKPTWGNESGERFVFGGAASHWQGYIAGLALYNRALSTEEINKSFSRFGQKD